MDRAVMDQLGQGQALIVRGDREAACTLYEELWTEAADANDHYQACVVAHFLAHAYVEPEAQLCWHLRALRAADAVGGERVRTFYPSLHANLADVYLRLGNRTLAGEHLDLACATVHTLQDNDYWHTILQELIARLTQTLADGH